METQLGLDLRGGMRVLLEADLSNGQTLTQQNWKTRKQSFLIVPTPWASVKSISRPPAETASSVNSPV
jgi:hypothetical protein